MNNTNKNHQFYVDRELVVAMINDDWSGLTQEECDSIDDFNETLIEDYGHALVAAEAGSRTLFVRCDCTDKFTECLTLTLLHGTNE